MKPNFSFFTIFLFLLSGASLSVSTVSEDVLQPWLLFVMQAFTKLSKGAFGSLWKFF